MNIINKHSISFLLNPENDSLKRKHSNDQDKDLSPKYRKIIVVSSSNLNPDNEISRSTQPHFSSNLPCRTFRKWTPEMEDELRTVFEKCQRRRKECVAEFKKNHRNLTEEAIKQRIYHLVPKLKSDRPWSRWTKEMKEELTELHKQNLGNKSCIEIFKKNHSWLSSSAINNKIHEIKTKGFC